MQIRTICRGYNDHPNIGENMFTIIVFASLTVLTITYIVWNAISDDAI